MTSGRGPEGPQRGSVEDSASGVRDDVLTVPNVLSALRLVGVPVFLWAILTHRDGLALGVLMLSGISDYLDGKIARRFNLVSRLGQYLDPIADRLYIASTLVGLAWREFIPWWLVGVLVLRDVLVAGMYPVVRRNRLPVPPVHYIGKAATFNLLYAFPLVLLGEGTSVLAEVVRPVGWAFIWWGTALYLLGGVIYAWQVREMVRQRRRLERAGRQR